MRRVIIESPYAADTAEGIERNIEYLRRCMHDCLRRGDAPYASHALYTQPGVLDDKVPEERTLGIEAGFAWHEVAEAHVVYVDLGITPGMQRGIASALRLGREIEYRSIDRPSEVEKAG